MVTAISTWGRKYKKSWVKSYNFLYSEDGEKWIQYSESGLPKVLKLYCFLGLLVLHGVLF